MKFSELCTHSDRLFLILGNAGGKPSVKDINSHFICTNVTRKSFPNGRKPMYTYEYYDCGVNGECGADPSTSNTWMHRRNLSMEKTEKKSIAQSHVCLLHIFPSLEYWFFFGAQRFHTYCMIDFECVPMKIYHIYFDFSVFISMCSRS